MRVVRCIAACAIVFTGIARARISAAPVTGPLLTIDGPRREVRFRATAHPSHLSRFFVQPGHHAVVWEKGRAHYGALFESAVSDHDVRNALRAVGGVAGENLSEATWNARRDATSREPDKRVEGSAVDVFVEWAGSGGAVPLSQLILENGKESRFDFRFGGNERFQKDFHSGCIVCDYSCPGGAIGNHNRTIREEQRLGKIFTVNRARVPPDDTVVTVILRLRGR